MKSLIKSLTYTITLIYIVSPNPCSTFLMKIYFTLIIRELFTHKTCIQTDINYLNKMNDNS